MYVLYVCMSYFCSACVPEHQYILLFTMSLECIHDCVGKVAPLKDENRIQLTCNSLNHLITLDSCCR